MDGLMAVRSPSARNTSRSSLHGHELREKQRGKLHDGITNTIMS